ncbi:MAG: hypothetical protein IT276_11630 [Ignavibacteriaceae bacterium]|nr:hypothetical protein [Ignavibacteriaceae bacterium]
MKQLFSVLLIAVLFTGFINAQNFATKGTIEAGGSIGFSSTTAVANGNSVGDALSTFILQPYIGYFISNGFELGVVPSYVSQSSGGSSISTFAIYLAPAWNFDLRSNLFPFLEGRIGYNTVSSGGSASGLAWGLRGGAKVKLGNSGLFNVAVSYDQLTTNPSGWSGDRIGQNIIAVNAGFSVFFGR